MSCLGLELGQTSAGLGTSFFCFPAREYRLFCWIETQKVSDYLFVIRMVSGPTFALKLLRNYYMAVIWWLSKLEELSCYYEKIKNLNTINIAWIDSILATLLFSLSESDIVLRPLILPGFGPRTTIIPEITFLYFLVPFRFN